MEVPTNPTAHRLMQAFALFRRLNWRQSPMAGLTPGEMMVLSCIKRAAPPEGGGLRVSEIGNLLRVAAPTITQQLNDMETRGYVEKQSDPDDRRAVRITLTRKGAETVGAAWAAFSASFTGLVDYLGEEDSTQLAELLTKAFAYFDEVSERAAEAGELAGAGDLPPRAARFPVNEHRGRSR
jgi:DNA-binding MarR family transcriptional regulator